MHVLSCDSCWLVKFALVTNGVPLHHIILHSYSLYNYNMFACQNAIILRILGNSVDIQYHERPLFKVL